MSAERAGVNSKAQRSKPAVEDKGASESDARLVRGCLRGTPAAWSALIEKYKNLIFSIPVKYGFSQDDATDIFQSVCVEMLSELSSLRKPKALPKWIVQVTAHKCFHHKQQLLRMTPSGPDGELPERSTPAIAEGLLRQAEEEQCLRQALAELPPRCRQLIQMLFFEEPVRPYQVIASELGLATGSIGFIRQRCLERLRKRLVEVGFA